MKKLVVILLASLVATSSFAVIDPDPDSIGIYFDTNADVNCMDWSGGAINAYVIWTNPSIPALLGYEFGYTNDVETGAAFYLTGTAYFNGVAEGTDIYTGQTQYTGEHSVVCVDPVVTGPATIIHAWEFLLYTPSYVNFYIYKGQMALGDLPLVLGTEEDKHDLTQSTGGDDFPVATLNTDCVVSVEEASFGSVKSLFR